MKRLNLFKLTLGALGILCLSRESSASLSLGLSPTIVIETYDDAVNFQYHSPSIENYCKNVDNIDPKIGLQQFSINAGDSFNMDSTAVKDANFFVYANANNQDYGIGFAKEIFYDADTCDSDDELNLKGIRLLTIWGVPIHSDYDLVIGAWGGNIKDIKVTRGLGYDTVSIDDLGFEDYFLQTGQSVNISVEKVAMEEPNPDPNPEPDPENPGDIQANQHGPDIDLGEGEEFHVHLTCDVSDNPKVTQCDPIPVDTHLVEITYAGNNGLEKITEPLHEGQTFEFFSNPTDVVANEKLSSADSLLFTPSEGRKFFKLEISQMVDGEKKVVKTIERDIRRIQFLAKDGNFSYQKDQEYKAIQAVGWTSKVTHPTSLIVQIHAPQSFSVDKVPDGDTDGDDGMDPGEEPNGNGNPQEPQNPEDKPNQNWLLGGGGWTCQLQASGAANGVANGTILVAMAMTLGLFGALRSRKNRKI